jgi:hypothetical protein
MNHETPASRLADALGAPVRRALVVGAGGGQWGEALAERFVTVAEPDGLDVLVDDALFDVVVLVGKLGELPRERGARLLARLACLVGDGGVLALIGAVRGERDAPDTGSAAAPDALAPFSTLTRWLREVGLVGVARARLDEDQTLVHARRPGSPAL